MKETSDEINCYKIKYNKINNINVLISGEFSYTPLGRHTLSFLHTLKNDSSINIFLDVIVHESAENDYLTLMNNREFKPANSKDFYFQYDFVFYTHIIPNNYDVCQYTRLNFSKRNGHIRGYYCVYDGTIPPLHWIDFINNKFDICLTPSRFIAQSLIYYGVKICCFGLHCLVINEDYLLYSKKINNRVFKFGFIGTVDFKKDVPLLINAFSNEFKSNEDIELHLHLTGIPDSLMRREIKSAIANSKKSKSCITITEGHLPQNEIEDIFKSFDAYVFPQKITGYFTTIAEALSIGLPVVTSSIPPLLEILDYIDTKNNIFWVDSKNFAPSFHSFSHYMLLGACFESLQTDLQKTLRNVFNNRNYLLNDKLVQKRKKAGKKLSESQLSSVWIKLIKPESIGVTISYFDLYNNILFLNQTLFDKYKKIYPTIEINDCLVTRRAKENSFWYLNTKEHDLIEKISKYHQSLILSMINDSKHNNFYERSIERELLSIIKRFLFLICKLLSSKKNIETLSKKIFKRLKLFIALN
ncbi:glycosyltransferase [Endozoicomonas sp. SCSIO W0465]|uniref:glycosyltransferase n=1 Tax=Endozoicomonas sp. SCSIO W0465 TaxID=2918516 RepID=UPI0020765A6A|nr:glycosyltransferase [Endozoicomonas sp. SCSIO W0465]USE33908.1 glycosyltransferase [Endozoicomonas sp. SCSIO W0465]